MRKGVHVIWNFNHISFFCHIRKKKNWLENKDILGNTIKKRNEEEEGTLLKKKGKGKKEAHFMYTKSIQEAPLEEKEKQRHL